MVIKRNVCSDVVPHNSDVSISNNHPTLWNDRASLLQKHVSSASENWDRVSAAAKHLSHLHPWYNQIFARQLDADPALFWTGAFPEAVAAVVADDG